MSERFYTNSELRPGPFQLQGHEAHHLAKASRMRPGDRVCLFNGNGYEYPSRIDSIDKRSVLLEVECVDEANRELPVTIDVACPLPKGDRAQFLIEKLTEIGVTSFIPLQTARSVVHPSDGKMEKLGRTVIEACKQCGRNKLMKLGKPERWETICKDDDSNRIRLMAHPEESDAKWSKVFSSINAKKNGFVVALGPEGGFTEEEVALGKRNGWQAVNLGERILRIETAALVLVSWIIRTTEGTG